MSGPPKNSDFFYKNTFVPCKKCLTSIQHCVLSQGLDGAAPRASFTYRPPKADGRSTSDSK